MKTETAVRRETDGLISRPRAEKGRATAMSETTIAQHTPGPWKLAEFDVNEGNYTRRFCVVRDVPDEPVADICEINEDLTGEEAPANARLIAAAPDLLAACKLALGAFERNDAIDWHDLEAAIAKAEGR